MRTCKWCGKSGWFLSLSKDGFCQSCESTVKASIIQATQMLNQSLALMKRAKDLDFRLSKATLAIEKLRELLPFYEKKLLRLNPSPQEWVAHIHSEERKMVTQYITGLFNQAIKVAQRTKDPAQRTDAFRDVNAALSKYESHLGRGKTQKWRDRVEAEMDYLIKDIENSVHKKDDKDRAIDQYLETLDILRSEYTGELEQAIEIKRIVSLIEEMGGKVPENRHAGKKLTTENENGSSPIKQSQS